MKLYTKCTGLVISFCLLLITLMSDNGLQEAETCKDMANSQNDDYVMESTLPYSTTIEPSENVPHVHENLHPSNLTLINIKNFRFLINQDICNISQIEMVTIVASAVENTKARNIIRETWGKPEIPGVNARLVFLLGMPSKLEKQKCVVAEALQYEDIIQGDYLDTYRNLSYKNIMGNLWVSQFCEQAEFVIKTDDDMFVDLYAVYFHTRHHVIEYLLLLYKDGMK
ncbi:beta-1,3-galactosyltransferase 2 isoform X2 [Eurytemora carolleeae]|uniref:beta-1,3-galactosyltransferase 2 isoform X2 n=1 Tax=Eurytemora carolleeae TaxID=1294199 RepID=UPI000C771478|nr:beta-1,3-galactosyltransferase 2 isoform X2 [Eurytemora carolleeae]|eukprot:XP_023337865.1 beta-1,3-galactosyltransferase 2-like isoform X2 [Eurytemora affinis]